ncbi:hypothetical protein TSOC_005208 [Tetrabaena socialis]|uniref:Uncharacterized protein n=1 Tax=Tetrabaena socialis TaxID=47790 RepID=A0A2J8A6U7_9CHLO|nr:hypothetical protein TSOC_005208 [Tetrabaena socialis]|eukprot:PNH08220.1 hypothetical protein TSOC_005208 [Tetrabaena socialis]
MPRPWGGVWFRYLGVTMAMEDAVGVVADHSSKNGGVQRPAPGAQFAASPVDDAFSTIMQWLYARIPDVHRGTTTAGAVVTA